MPSDGSNTGIEREAAPSLESFDPWKLDQPDDGIVYLYRSSVDGFWRVINDEDIALEEATGYPVGELIEYEEMGDYQESESGELRAIYVPQPNTEEEKIAHQAVVVEETFVGTKDTGETHVKDIRLPADCTMIHPEAADRIRDKYDINYLHKFGVYVAPDRCVDTEADHDAE